MAERPGYSRRAFLQKFAALSVAPLLAGLLPSCSSPRETMAAYGPPPAGSTTVTGIFFLDAQTNQVSLSGSSAVPVHTQFVINFSDDMNMDSVAAAISFVDAAQNEIPCAKIWDTTNAQQRTISVTPDSDLAHTATYTLSVKQWALDSSGYTLSATADATAHFTTQA